MFITYIKYILGQVWTWVQPAFTQAALRAAPDQPLLSPLAVAVCCPLASSSIYRQEGWRCVTPDWFMPYQRGTGARDPGESSGMEHPTRGRSL